MTQNKVKEMYQITKLCHSFMKRHINKGDFCIDATMGNGTDTLFLCQEVGRSGKVIAFDIQEKALENTGKLLSYKGFDDVAHLFLESHEEIDKHIKKESKKPSCIVFNFGYLPGGNKEITTKVESDLIAIEKSLAYLKKGGLLSLCLYSGGENGGKEREKILDFVRKLDSKKYLVITLDYYNRPNNPPLPVMIIKE